MSGRLFLGMVVLTASDLWKSPRRGSEEGLLSPDESFSCLWKRNIGIRAQLIPGLEWSNSLVLGVSVPNLWPLAFILLVSLLPLGLKLILSLSCSQTLEDFQPGLQRYSEFPCLFNPVSLCTQPLLSNHLRHALAFPFSLASAFVVSIGQPRNHVKMVPRGQFH